MLRQSGVVVKDNGGRIVHEEYGPNAETAALDWLNTHAFRWRFAGYSIAAAFRDVPQETVTMEQDAARVAALLAGAGATPLGSGAGRVPEETEKDGYALGSALARIIGISATADTSALITFGMFFSELRGYRDLRTGNTFVSAFAQGFKDASDGALEDAENRKRIGSGDKSQNTPGA